MSHKYLSKAKEEDDECMECGLTRVRIEDNQPDGFSTKTLYRKWGEISYTESEPNCIE